MNIRESILIALGALRANKLRSFLTLLGIVLGVMTVIAMMTIIEGINANFRQEMELVGTLGKVEFDQQYRGLRATITGVGSKTFNPHFTRDVHRVEEGTNAYDGYGKDSIVAIVERALEVHLGLSSRDRLQGKIELTEDNIADALKDIRMSLLEADV